MDKNILSKKYDSFFSNLKDQNILFEKNPITKILYSTDASIYQILPEGVVFPKDVSEIRKIVLLAYEFQIPLIPRGAGTNTTGSAVGDGIVINLYQRFNKILEINQEEKYALVEPGVIYENLNKAIASYNLQFGPDPASGNRASIGGMIGTNATGAHSIVYGMTSDQIIGLEVLLSDGSLVDLTPDGFNEIIGENGLIHGFSELIKKIQNEKSALIQRTYPHVWRKSSGYNLDSIIGWSKTKPPEWDSFMNLPYPPTKNQPNNLIPLFVGAEGTLGIITKAKLRLVELPKEKDLILLPYDSAYEACSDVERLLEYHPAVIELFSHNIMTLAQTIPAYADNLNMLPEIPQALLVVEFTNQKNKINTIYKKIHKKAILVSDEKEQKKVWNARKAGLGIISSIPGNKKPQPLIEDVSVPIEHLASYVKDIQEIFSTYDLKAEIYAHASAGCLHIRPIMSIKSKESLLIVSEILSKVSNLCIKYNGVMSGEHGDGLIRGAISEQTFHPEIISLFEKIKNAADPKSILNPGKKIFTKNPISYPLRFTSEKKEVKNGFFKTNWETEFSFKNHLNLIQSIEMCNGAGVCMKTDEQVMCPSYKTLKDELFSPRGRSNIFRAYLKAEDKKQKQELEKAVFKSIDNCFECKGCKSECPSTVDISRLKYEFLYQYYKTHPRKISDYLFGYFNSFVIPMKKFAFLVNIAKENKLLRKIAKKLFKISNAHFPNVSSELISFKFDETSKNNKKLFFLADSFNQCFEPENINHTIKLFHDLQYDIEILPFNHTGRTFISKGFLKKAKKHAEKFIDHLKLIDPNGEIPIIGIEPSEIITLRDEFQDFFPNDEYVLNMFSHSYLFDEFIIRNNLLNKLDKTTEGSLIIHGHCYQKSAQRLDDTFPVGTEASIALLAGVGYEIQEIPSGCCGMAGSFGYEENHYDLSMQVGEIILFPAVRESKNIVVAPGISCRGHIVDGTGKEAIHPIKLIKIKT